MDARRRKGLRLGLVSELLETIRKMLSSRPKLAFAYLYGSCVFLRQGGKGSFLPGDIDVAVYIREGDPLKMELDLQLQLHKLTGLSPEVLDVRAVNQAPLSIAIKIITQGKLIFYRDEEIHTNYVESVGSNYRQLRGLIDAAYG